MAIWHLLNLSYVLYVYKCIYIYIGIYFYMCLYVLKALFLHKSLLCTICAHNIRARQYWCSEGYILHAIRKHQIQKQKCCYVFQLPVLHCLLSFTICISPKNLQKILILSQIQKIILKIIALDWSIVFLKAQDKENYCWKSVCTTCTIHWL